MPPLSLVGLDLARDQSRNSMVLSFATTLVNAIVLDDLTALEDIGW